MTDFQVDPADPMRHWRRNNGLILGLILMLLLAVFAIAYLLQRSNDKSVALQASRDRADVALADAKALHDERDKLILRLSQSSPGSADSSATLQRLVQTTVPLNGRDGLSIVGPAGAKGDRGVTGTRGVSVTGARGVSGAAGKDGTDGAAGKDGTDGAPGSNGTNGTNGTDGQPPSSFTFTSNGTTYECLPDGGGHYSCTPEPAVDPSPSP